ncbi:MarR family transcriptional regulator [Phyllobacterium brassicacearum]|uniref:MarR family transcriptional regulator n=2 Tax=Phyllobacterium brassicacearum TaxID=314235 RepID=A0A2P7B875_9HYPH|nr:MarR family transcriptional regulator [Phyllobacterium brassicacearum]TDQ14841.1 DNA-binding MarR family transcriptional regulator [Phyllobacterium brassicacearum]
MIKKLLHEVTAAETSIGYEAEDISKPSHGVIVTHFELARTLDRLNRRFAMFLQTELTKLGVTEIGPFQAMILFGIGNDEFSVGQLLERGNYSGTNMSYHLRQLSEGGFVERVVSQRDRRSTPVRLSTKGQKLCADLNAVGSLCNRFVAKSPDDLRNLAVAFQTLHKIDQVFESAARYR